MISNLKVWQALSLLGLSRDGQPLSEERSRRALRQVGMRKREMDEPYPEEGIDELIYLIEHPDKLDKQSEEASRWMIRRN
jgi:hypothetical protein